jgi:hypothetical protein
MAQAEAYATRNNPLDSLSPVSVSLTSFPGIFWGLGVSGQVNGSRGARIYGDPAEKRGVRWEISSRTI